MQIAWVTHDLDATETALTGLLGVKRWVRMAHVHFAPDTCSYRGRPADFVASISLSYLGDMQLELVAPVRGANIYSDFLRDNGPGLHHICVEADSAEHFAATVAAATERGASVVQQGVMPGGMRFAYVSAPHAGVPFIEIAYISAEIRQFFDYIKQEQR
jgi:catechol 2,3-dioxygenase-like lactoylglutathione lyase family enzyme